MSKLSDMIVVGSVRFCAGTETATAQAAIDRLYSRYAKLDLAVRQARIALDVPDDGQSSK